jgi:hypothetical protein
VSGKNKVSHRRVDCGAASAGYSADDSRARTLGWNHGQGAISRSSLVQLRFQFVELLLDVRQVPRRPVRLRSYLAWIAKVVPAHP